MFYVYMYVMYNVYFLYLFLLFYSVFCYFSLSATSRSRCGFAMLLLRHDIKMYRFIILNLGSRWRWVVSFTIRQFYHQERAFSVQWVGGWILSRPYRMWRSQMCACGKGWRTNALWCISAKKAIYTWVQFDCRLSSPEARHHNTQA
jgi:hypothetical protein